MAKFYREPDRRQGFFLPVDMSDWVKNTDMDHLLLDLSAFKAHYRKRGTGAPHFAPLLMVGVLIFAYANGQRSSRKIKRLCDRDAGFRIIVGDQAPDHNVIARFRKQHRREFAALFVEVLKLCHAADLVRPGVVALDGTKVRANAALSANRTAKSMEEEVAAMVSEAEETDTADDAMVADERGDEIPADLRNSSDRLDELEMAHGDGRSPRLFKNFTKTQLRILDDSGPERLNASQRRDLMEIVEDKYEVGSTLITNQLPIDAWHDLIGEPTFADAILDRLVHNAYRIQFEGQSMRKTQLKAGDGNTQN